MLSPADATFRAVLARELPEGRIRDRRDGELLDPRGRRTGQAGFIVTPHTVQEVSTVISHCNQAKIGVVPLGGGTGLVLGQIAHEGPEPVVLSLEKMTAVREVFPLENTIVVEAGAILADVQQAAQEVDRLFPLSLAAEGSCRIGGNLATNAGGLNVLRYGNTRELCLGIEAVLPDGSIYHGLKRLRKDNTGFDIKNLLIGSEGALGVITAASLRLFPRPDADATAIMVVRDPHAALDLLALARQQIGDAVSAFELMSGQGLEFLAETQPEVAQPFDEIPDWSVLIDIGVSGESDAQEKMVQLFAQASAQGIVSNGILSTSQAQRNALWSVRERIPEANKRIGSIASHDISIPLSRIPDFIPEGIARLKAIAPDIRVNCFGHLGDGNLHYNAFPAQGENREKYNDIKGKVTRAVHDLVAEYDGSFSAEHGVGRLKADDLARYADPAKLAAMRAIKAALDPNGIMNPGAVLR